MAFPCVLSRKIVQSSLGCSFFKIIDCALNLLHGNTKIARNGWPTFSRLIAIMYYPQWDAPPGEHRLTRRNPIDDYYHLVVRQSFNDWIDLTHDQVRIPLNVPAGKCP